MRERFVRWLDEIVAKYPPQIPVEVEELADLLNVVVEGAIIQSKALRDESLMGKQTRQYPQLHQAAVRGLKLRARSSNV